MAEIEGVIKYQLNFLETESVSENLRELNVWRSILYQLNLIGQNADRYGGYGYGNLSVRSTMDQSCFIISGTQTGRLSELDQNHYVSVYHCDVAKNQVFARGPVKPSSEALTHSMIYQLNPSIECVMHVHDPVLWHFGLEHDIARTEESVAFGTPEMGSAVARLYRSGNLDKKRTLVMAGHEDGVIFFGESIAQAGQALLEFWLLAYSD